MANNRMDTTEARNLSESLKAIATNMEVRNTNIKKNFVNLGESFKDATYSKMEEDFNAANQSVEKIISDTRELAEKLKVYAQRMDEIDAN